MKLLDIWCWIVSPGTGRILEELTNLGDVLMATMQEVQLELEEVTAQVTKVGEETRTLIEKIDLLEEAIKQGSQTTPEVDAALAALKAQVAVVDELVPDAS